MHFERRIEAPIAICGHHRQEYFFSVDLDRLLLLSRRRRLGRRNRSGCLTKTHSRSNAASVFTRIKKNQQAS